MCKDTRDWRWLFLGWTRLKRYCLSSEWDILKELSDYIILRFVWNKNGRSSGNRWLRIDLLI